ncbi:hypothetical protein DMN91_011740 [Ooceraea biroi]|uniref:Cytochrome P450 6k1 n=1 Tax=Ooceraea biroi TaxID=2015173 RepID=A0A026W4J9_OOCBI|nr:cytochrome P450 6k1 [Ooceraea biroi]XP_011345902.1 cytochrome P450 6k1 [Ooceraea biroi]EZA49969.1 Cytochrome P450 6k1 [Ooceraea biroi]RLU15982.1 hypothetical protein DMN91_011740 [Ooceraea biroi]
MDYLVYYCTTALAIVVGLFYVYAKHNLSYWSRRGVKTPPPHLIFGNFRDCILLQKTPADQLQEIYNSADPDDPYVGMYIFHEPVLLLRDRSLIKQIMITDFENFGNRRFGLSNERDATGYDSILSIRQPRWKYLRRKLTPVVTGQKLRNMMPLMIKSSNEMIDFIENLPVDKTGGKTYEVRNLGSRYCANVLGSVMFGVDTNSFNEDDKGFLISGEKVFRSFSAGVIFIIFFFVPRLSFLLAPLLTGPAEYFRKVFWSSMKVREEMGIKRGDLVDSLLSLKAGEQDPLYKFEGDHLPAQSSSLFQAGFEAGSTTIAFALFHLACHPEHQATLYDEIQTHLAGKEWTMDLMNEMSFTERVLLEALRLFPPLPITDRIAEKDYKIPGTDLIIEKGVSVYLSLNSTSQDPRYFSDPQKFDPLRKSLQEDKKFFESLGFGIGPRACMGTRMGLLFMKIALIAIVTNYTLHYETDGALQNSNINGMANKKKVRHVFQYAADGLHVQFKKRA